MKKLSHSDGGWSAVLSTWSKQCHEYGEDLENYAPETVKLLGELVEETAQNQWDGVYSISDHEDTLQGVCFVNGAFIKGFSGRVLRVRHLLLTPENDFGDYDEAQYAARLGNIFNKILVLSDEALNCPHVKIHFRSPADVAFFSKFPEFFKESEHFATVQMVGAWLMLTKK